MTRLITGEVDPLQNYEVPMWVVYGFDCFPSILCCKLKQCLVSRDVIDTIIWGYSVYHRQPGFRTLGQTLTTWREGNAKYGKDLEKWFIKQEDAVAFINKLVTPSAKVL